MSKLFFNLGRTVGHVAIPVIRKSKAAWQSAAGSEAEALEAEAEFGRAFAAELRLKIGTAANPSDLEPLRQILERLRQCVRNKARTFAVDVLFKVTPAAIALPGGFLFVTTGLLDFCQRSTNELAFVLGHEMAHVIRGHAQARFSERIGKEGLSSLVSRGLLNPLLREGTLDWLDHAFTPEEEAEADEFAARVIRAAGFDPAGGERFVRRIGEQHPTEASLGSYLSSHPPLPVRLASLRQAHVH